MSTRAVYRREINRVVEEIQVERLNGLRRRDRL